MSSHLPGGLGHFADKQSSPQNQLNIFHPSLIATVLQMFPLLLCIPLLQQYHSSRIDEVSKFDASTMNLHRMCPIPMICLCKRLSAFLTAPRTFVSSSLFPEKFLFCTGMSVSIEWLNPVLRPRIGDRFEIHTSFVEDFVICCHQVTKLFYSRYCFRQCVFFTELLSSWFAKRLRNFGLLGCVCVNTVLPECHF